jgi:outer membrane protein
MKKIIAAGVLAMAGSAAQALEAGDTIIRLGMSTDIPHETTSIVGGMAGTDDVSLEYTSAALGNITYMFTPNWGMEFTQTSPFNHQVMGHGGAAIGHIGEFDVMYSALTAQYHFNAGDFSPYVGLGVGYAYMLNTELKDSDPAFKLAGLNKMDMNNDTGYVAQIGVDYKLNDHAYANLSAMYMDMSSKAEITGPGGKVNIDMDINPVMVNVAFGYKL